MVRDINTIVKFCDSIEEAVELSDAVDMTNMPNGKKLVYLCRHLKRGDYQDSIFGDHLIVSNVDTCFRGIKPASVVFVGDGEHELLAAISEAALRNLSAWGLGICETMFVYTNERARAGVMAAVSKMLGDEYEVVRT